MAISSYKPQGPAEPELREPVWCQGLARASCAQSCSSPCEHGAGVQPAGPMGARCMCVCAQVNPPTPGAYLLMEKIFLAKLGSLLVSLLPVLGLPHHRGLCHRSHGHFLCETRAMAT